jgi:hypothetical protein
MLLKYKIEVDANHECGMSRVVGHRSNLYYGYIVSVHGFDVLSKTDLDPANEYQVMDDSSWVLECSWIS